jgi:hypothetical protein
MPEQGLLLPTSLAEWLPEDHLAYLCAMLLMRWTYKTFMPATKGMAAGASHLTGA